MLENHSCIRLVTWRWKLMLETHDRRRFGHPPCSSTRRLEPSSRFSVLSLQYPRGVSWGFFHASE